MAEWLKRQGDRADRPVWRWRNWTAGCAIRARLCDSMRAPISETWFGGDRSKGWMEARN